MHRGKVTLKCDIEFSNKIIFTDVDVWFYADIDITTGRYEDDYEINGWSSDDVISYDNNRLKMSEWVSSKEVEDFQGDADYDCFALIVKDTQYDDIEIDYDMLEPDWDMMREGK